MPPRQKVCPKCFSRFADTERFCLHDSAILVEEQDIARLGTAIGNYKLLKILGRGGMGTVYAGEHVYIKKPVAVKVLHPQFARYPEAVNRFLREARAASSINHPNIVDVTDFGLLPDGVVYFVMEFLEGVSLEDVIEREGAVELHRALNVANQISHALEAAHHAGVIHRDLKPDNIMLLQRPGRRDLVKMAQDQIVMEKERTYDFVKVLDFGIAKIMVPDELVAETVQGAVFGTPEYMSPEAARGEDVDHRADVYSLGVILFDMLCGRPPFEASQSSDVLNMHINQPPPSPREFAPHREITEAAEKVILRAMQKDANKRYQTMADFRRDVENSYGTVSYRRHGSGVPGIAPVGREARKRPLTDEIDEWIRSDNSGLTVEQARMLALVDAAERSFSPPGMAPDEAERLASALDRALDDDK
ncbi:MAG: serine/threonine protein kinase [Kofleriaceae bacterium]|jgi:serine/threonine protein kinase|nr:serine/threonine protein kinase [Kofleriaceae bacterium]MBP9206653.1 serine/threonine protein kinase [Kofleriaceae bacterium]